MAIPDSSIRLRETDKIPLVEHNLTRYQLKTCLTVPPSHIYYLSVFQSSGIEIWSSNYVPKVNSSLSVTLATGMGGANAGVKFRAGVDSPS